MKYAFCSESEPTFRTLLGIRERSNLWVKRERERRNLQIFVKKATVICALDTNRLGLGSWLYHLTYIGLSFYINKARLMVNIKILKALENSRGQKMLQLLFQRAFGDIKTQG